MIRRLLRALFEGASWQLTLLAEAIDPPDPTLAMFAELDERRAAEAQAGDDE